MQYFTFLGTGIDNSYKEVFYYFDNNKNDFYTSRYIQSAILAHYSDEISDVYVFCTEKSYLISSKGLIDEVRECFNVELHFIKLSEDVTSEEIMSKMLNSLKEDFIIDITHSYRSIPIAVMMMSNYLEVSTGKSLKHLYYGKLYRDEEEANIIDLIDLYNNSKIVSELESFDKYLKVSDDSLKKYEDEKINTLILAVNNFNHMLEYCEFDKSIYAIDRIYQFCQCIIKESDKYVLLIPYLKSIQNKLKDIYDEKEDAIKKAKFVQLLLNHNLVQIAVTFTDQLIREELIHYCYFANEKRFNPNLLHRNSTFIYSLSSDLLYYLGIRKRGKTNSNVDVISYRKAHYHLEKNALLLDKKSIDIFYIDIRNKVNHGGGIDNSINVKEICNKCIESIIRFVQEG